MEKVRIHLDTDLGADVDDLCALAWLMRNPKVEITGITTCLEQGGVRAAYAEDILRQYGQGVRVPVVGGADYTWSGEKDFSFTYAHEERMFGHRYPRKAAYQSRAVSSIRESLEQGAVVAAIGPLTNIAEFDREYPGRLNRNNLFIMGGCLHPPEEGWPQWGPSSDWNLHMDKDAAQWVMNRISLTMVEVAVTLKTYLTERDCRQLDKGDGFCRLLARQAREWRTVSGFIEEQAAQCTRLPSDLCNFHYDPLTVAIASGYEHIKSEDIRIRFSAGEAGEEYVLQEVSEGNPVRVITDVDTEAFNRDWLAVVTGTSISDSNPAYI
ncbi:MAG: nucleoside hydrolase [Eisenbergiella sp.]|jgi:purine nucleosidase|uniref:nucleoside hydrolase n=3 Tax=Eisenbergiella TaxID=1432051 RepID=UPI000E4E4CDC|nr:MULTISPECIES: nucleoside hydrolase [unclassified Eisenbergiella]MBS5534767.1 nucleoside hydrolase [Lachnospiraceae bacterium]RHP92357.1 nucleoside hydrolase [Eisenbergiella sp. OF01-20]BDF45834.1 hypothetical protein CE91St56_29570 [Lachnospiraceae bacterium]GKH41903.1 hypothetical protein CE91St57_28770 [Lachnospiraceae bacterium]